MSELPGRVIGFALLAAVAVVLLVLVLTSGGGSYQVTAEFQDAYGVVTGDDVWTGGGIVGSVSGIKLGSDGLPQLTMRIDDSYQMHATGKAQLEFGSNSGELNRIVMLTSGTGAQLSDGATIPVSRTISPVELDDVLSTFTPKTRTDIRYVLAQLDSATSGLSGAFKQSLSHSARALGETTNLIGQVTGDGHALQTLVSQSDIAAGAFASQGTALKASVDQLSHLLGTTASRQSQLQQAVAEMAPGLEDPRVALNQLNSQLPTIETLVSAAKPAVAQVEPTSKLLAMTLTAADGPLDNIAATLHYVPSRLQTLDSVLKVANPVVKQLTPVATQLLPILDVVRVYTPEIAGFFSGWAGMSSSFDAAGRAIRLAINPLPPNVGVPEDSNKPGYIPAPFQRPPGALVGQPWDNYSSSFLSSGATQ